MSKQILMKNLIVLFSLTLAYSAGAADNVTIAMKSDHLVGYAGDREVFGPDIRCVKTISGWVSGINVDGYCQLSFEAELKNGNDLHVVRYLNYDLIAPRESRTIFRGFSFPWVISAGSVGSAPTSTYDDIISEENTSELKRQISSACQEERAQLEKQSCY